MLEEAPTVSRGPSSESSGHRRQSWSDESGHALHTVHAVWDTHYVRRNWFRRNWQALAFVGITIILIVAGALIANSTEQGSHASESGGSSNESS